MHIVFLEIHFEAGSDVLPLLNACVHGESHQRLALVKVVALIKVLQKTPVNGCLVLDKRFEAGVLWRKEANNLPEEGLRENQTSASQK